MVKIEWLLVKPEAGFVFGCEIDRLVVSRVIACPVDIVVAIAFLPGYGFIMLLEGIGDRLPEFAQPG